MTPIFHRGMRIAQDSNLGFAMLVAEDEEGTAYEPIDVVSTLREALELAKANMRSKEATLEQDGDPGICPERYVVWIRGCDTAREPLCYFNVFDWSMHTYDCEAVTQ